MLHPSLHVTLVEMTLRTATLAFKIQNLLHRTFNVALTPQWLTVCSCASRMIILVKK